MLSNDFSFSNDAWSDEIKDGENGFYFAETLSENFAGSENNSAWADDYLWLPSVTEAISQDDGDLSYVGLWGLSKHQLTNYDGVRTSLIAPVVGAMQNDTYFRTTAINDSGNYNYLSMTADGEFRSVISTSEMINLRPAMHLNLASLPTDSTNGLSIKNKTSEYDGTSKVDDISFIYEGNALDASLYTLEYYKGDKVVSDIVDAGEYKIVFNGLGDLAETHTGIEFRYIVKAIDLSELADVTLGEIPEYIEGETSSIEPEVSVTYNGETLKLGEDYLLTYINNESPTALAKVEIEFVGNYTGEIIKNFIISGIDLSVVGITSPLHQEVYEGDGETIHKYHLLEVYAEGIRLVEGVDYTWYFENPDDESDKTNTLSDSYFIGAGKKYIVIEGIGNYKGSTKIYYTITLIDLSSSAEITIDAVPPFIEGVTTSVEPSLTVSYSGEILEEGTDYTLSYKNNTYPNARAEVTVTFIGKYTGTRSAEYVIGPIELKYENVVCPLHLQEYEGDGVTIHKYGVEELYCDGILLEENVDYIWNYLDFETGEICGFPDEYFISAGVKFILVEGMGNYSGQFVIYYTVKGIDASSAEVTYGEADYTYDGEEKELPVLSVVFNEKTLIKGQDYHVYYQDNIKASEEAYVRIVFAGEYSGEIEHYYTIKHRDINEATLDGVTEDFEYDGATHKIGFTLTYGGKQLSSVDDYESEPIFIKEVGSYTITITGIGSWKGTRSFVVKVLTPKAIKIESVDSYFWYREYKQGVLSALNVRAYINDSDGNPMALSVLGWLFNLEWKAYRDGVETEDIDSAGMITFIVSGIKQQDWCYIAEGEELEFQFEIKQAEVVSVEYTNFSSTHEYDRNPFAWTFVAESASPNSHELYKEDFNITYYKWDYELQDYSTEGTSSVTDAGKYKWVFTPSSNYLPTGKYYGEVNVKTYWLGTDGAYIRYYYSDGNGNYTDAFGNISNTKVYVGVGEKYSGRPLEVDVYFNKYMTYELIEGTEYSINYDDSLLESDKKLIISVTGRGNYSETVTAEFFVNYYRLADAEITVSGRFVYNYGNPITLGSENLAVVNKKTGEELVYGTDYEFFVGDYDNGSEVVYIDKFTSNINAGTASVYLNGLGSYAGVVRKSFSIQKLDISNEEVKSKFALEYSEVIYNMEFHTPAVTHQNLSFGNDFEVAYSENKNAGEASVLISGKNNCDGSVKINFTIKPMSISQDDNESEIEWKRPSLGSDELPNYYVYLHYGSYVNEYFELLHNDYELSSLSDYSIAYYRGGELTEDNTSLGEVTVVLTGEGNYSGTRTHNFRIMQNYLNDTRTLKIDFLTEYSYNGVDSFKGKFRNYYEYDYHENGCSTYSYNLEEGTDYTLKYFRNGSETSDVATIGEVTVVATGIGNWQGEVSHTFTITKAIITRFDRTEYVYKYTMTHQAPTPLFVYDNNNNTIDIGDYVIDYYIFEGNGVYRPIYFGEVDFVNPGKYKLVASVNPARNNYTGEAVAYFEIQPKPLSEILSALEIENLFEDKEFTNSDIEQDITINFGDYELVEGEDFEIKYENNKETGEVIVTITGKGDYEGDLETSFEIIKKPFDSLETNNGKMLSDLVIEKEYTGSKVSLSDADFTDLIEYGDGYLVPGEDFLWEYEDEEAERTEVGEYTIVLHGQGNYSNTVRATMKITAIDFSVDLTVEDIPNQTFTGHEIEPLLTFYIKGTESDLVLGTDYTIEIVNNTNVGIATITLTGTGIYTGSYDKTFEIVPVVIDRNENFEFTYQNENTFTGNALLTEIEIGYDYNLQDSSDAVALVSGDDFDKKLYIDGNANGIYDAGDTLIDGDAVDAGKYLICIEAKGNYTGSVYMPFEVKRLDLSTAISQKILSINGILESYEYKASAINPIVRVLYKSTDISKGNFTITYGANTLVSTGGSVTITASESSNFKGALTYTFAIAKTVIQVSVGLKDNTASYVVGGTLPELVILSSNGVEGSLAYVSSSETLKEGENSYRWVFTPSDLDNYEIVYGDIDITALSPKEDESNIILIIIIASVVVLAGGIFFIILFLKKKKKEDKNDDESSVEEKETSEKKEIKPAKRTKKTDGD